MTRSRVLLTAALAVVVAGLLAVGAVLPVAGPVGAATSVPAVAGAGGVVCPLGDTVAGAELDLVLAAPAATGDAVAARTTEVVVGATPSRTAPPAVPAGGVRGVPLDVAADGTSWVGWADAPVVAWRDWRRLAAPGLPRGRAGGPCVGADATTWHVVGLRTDGGSEARLRFANPFGVDATLAVDLVTTEGTVRPLALQNLSVPARGTADLRVNDHVPERPDVAAIVRVTSGRAAVEGLQLALAGIGGVDGLTLVPPATAAARDWTLPWVPGADDARVWVLNPSERDVELEVTVHAADGPGLPPGPETLAVAAGALVRVGAADLVPAGTAAVGVSLRSPTDPVVVGGALRIDPGDAARSGIAALPALAAGDTGWLVAGRAEDGRTRTLRLVNVHTDAVRVSIELRTPDSPPRALSEVEVPAGARRDVVLPAGDVGAFAAEVTADGPVVVALSELGAPVPDPVVTAGVPAAAWRPAAGLAGVRREGWTLRLPRG